ncbi:hypothetical protein [Undibacterium sp. Di24W]|uniref:hypothetical protein n=1 Tax=Undibacterium sp. Di24W TaxID=3413033 RepID=UPI003BF01538
MSFSTLIRKWFAQLVQRSFLLLWFGLLLMPALIHLTKIDVPDATLENRQLAAIPLPIKDLDSALNWTAQMDAYLKDHFGLRQTMIAWNNQIRYFGLGESASPQLTVGKEHMLFFNSHEAAYPNRMLNFLCGKDIRPEIINELATRVSGFLLKARQINPNTSIGFVPTKPVLYTEYLPDWMQAECQQKTHTLPVFLQTIAQFNATDAQQTALSASIYYPWTAMQKLKSSVQLYPKEDFHWHGRGAQVFAQDIAERQWQLPALRHFNFYRETVSSDMQRFMPGVALKPTIESPDYANAQITACLGPQCFPELASAAKLSDVSRYRLIPAGVNPKGNNRISGKKLLLISDSFGNGVAGYFSAYFDEVWHISINNSGQLSSQEMLDLQASFESYAPDKVLYLLHDYSLTCFSGKLHYCPVDLVKVLSQLHPKAK